VLSNETNFSEKDRRIAWTFIVFWLFALTIIAIQWARVRAFWLDEAMVFQSLRTRSTVSILFDGPLEYGQMFPKVHIALIKIITDVFGRSPRACRGLSSVWGLLGIGVWLGFFYEQLWIIRRQAIACLVAGGLLVANAYTLYYEFELKQYSADLFFSGLLFFLYYTKTLREKNRLYFLSVASLASLMFSYTSVFILLALFLSILSDPKERALWRQHWAITCTLIPCFLVIAGCLYAIDYQFGAQGGGATVLKNYWAQQFIERGGWSTTLNSAHLLYEHFLTAWWRTSYGPVDETMVPRTTWFAWPLSTFKNPDIRNALCALSLLLVGRTFYKMMVSPSSIKDPMLSISWLLIVMAGLAWTHHYPWDCSRLTLYGLPVALYLVMESMIFISELGQKMPFHRVFLGIIWMPYIWAIIRNSFLLSGLFSSAPMYEDINELVKRMNPETSHTLIVSSASDVGFDVYDQMPPSFRVLKEGQTSYSQIQKEVSSGPCYFLWVHKDPDGSRSEISITQNNRVEVQSIFGGHFLRMELMLLKPKLNE
jgi:hypothetical protein